MLSSATFCRGQSAPRPQTSEPVPSTQPPAISPPKMDKPTDQPSAQSQDQNSPQQNTKPEDTKTNEDSKKTKDDRMFYVMPNYLTVENQSQVKPISWKEKFAISAKGSFDPYEFVIVGVVAGIRQAGEFLSGVWTGDGGIFKRYGAAFADQVDGNIMVGGVYPTILKDRSSLFSIGQGPVAAPLWLCHQPGFRHTKRLWREYVQHSRVCGQRDGDCHFQRLLSCRRSWFFVEFHGLGSADGHRRFRK